MDTLWHGGPAGLTGKILPPSQTDARGTVDVLDGTGLDTGHVRSDKVFVTPVYEAAAMFASAHADPMVYGVLPDGELEADPDCSDPEISMQCDSATILFAKRPDPALVREARAIFGAVES